NHYLPGKTNPHLPHDGLEMQPPPKSAEDIERAKSNADDLVRSLMGGDVPASPAQGARAAQTGAPAMPSCAPQAKLVEVSPSAVNADPDPVARPAAKLLSHPISTPLSQHLMRDADPVQQAPNPQEDTGPEIEAPRPQAETPIELCDDAIVKKVLKDAFPPLAEQPAPDPRHDKAQKMAQGLKGRAKLFGVLAFGAVLCMIWPLQMMGLALLGVMLFVGFTLLMKVPFLARLLHKAWLRYADRAPERAERLRKGADATAGVIEQVLDVLPGALADRLAMPDFSKPVTRQRG
ncbi:MAG: hypothetical protein AAFZ04_11095, partial [Pseudomonadota bacterium]